MTNAIETTKREMYEAWKAACKLPIGAEACGTLIGFEVRMEDHLEQLRQQYEQMAATARDRFESIQSLEQANQELQRCNDNQRESILVGQSRLEAMTEERDAIRNKLQAFEFANKSSGEFLIDALRKVKSQRKTIKALRKAQEARESVGATSVSSCGDVSRDEEKDAPKLHSQSCARPVDGVTYVSTSESNGVVSIYCTACHRLTKKEEVSHDETFEAVRVNSEAELLAGMRK